MTENEKLKLAKLEAKMPPKGKYINISRFTILSYYRWKIWLFFHPNWANYYHWKYGAVTELYSETKTINASFKPNSHHPFRIEYYHYANNRKWNSFKSFIKNIFTKTCI